jgi:hypothetical protein
MKEGKMQRDSSNTSRSWCSGRSPAEGVFSQRQKPTAAYRLGVDIGRGLDGKFCWVEDFPRVELRIARGS